MAPSFRNGRGTSRALLLIRRSLDRTDSVLFTGLSVNGFVNAPNQGLVFLPLEPFEERGEPELAQSSAMAAALEGDVNILAHRT